MTRLRQMVLATLIGVSANVVLAQMPAPAPAKAQEPEPERVYGSQLMTVQERTEYRQQMRSLKTQEERLLFQKEHHAKMQQRAKERGVTLPEEPLEPRPGPGPRDGPRPGTPPGPAAGGPGGGPGGGSGRP